MTFQLSAAEVAAAIDIPVKQWPGNCYSIACAMLTAKLVRGKSRYGHYHGFIHDDCEQFGGRQFTHHGWIERKKTIVDPTRWVFECEEPYIYVGPKDDPDYDFGGNRLRMSMMKPPPPFDGDQQCWPIPQNLLEWVRLMLGSNKTIASIQQVMWLANLPLPTLQDHARPLFEWIRDGVRFPGFIPIDNRLEVLGPDKD